MVAFTADKAVVGVLIAIWGKKFPARAADTAAFEGRDLSPTCRSGDVCVNPMDASVGKGTVLLFSGDRWNLLKIEFVRFGVPPSAGSWFTLSGTSCIGLRWELLLSAAEKYSPDVRDDIAGLRLIELGNRLRGDQLSAGVDVRKPSELIRTAWRSA